VALAIFILSAASLGRHGMTYDSPALFYSADRTVFWMGHRDLPKALDLRGANPPGFSTPFTAKPSPGDVVSYPVFPALVGAITAHIFSGLEPVDGHHLGPALLNAVALFLFCLYAARLLGRGAGIAATVALALFPSALGHSINNAKDWPCAAFYGLALLAFGVGVIERRARDVLIAGAFLGLALSSKINALFALVTVGLWAPFAYVWLYRGRADVW